MVNIFGGGSAFLKRPTRSELAVISHMGSEDMK